MTERQEREVDDSEKERTETEAGKDMTPIWKDEDGDGRPDEGVEDQPGASTPAAIAGTSALGQLGGTIGAAAGGGLDVEDPDAAAEK
jgi:hypothetical protein